MNTRDGAGRAWPAEWKESRDSETGVRIRQLTDYRGHSYHLYFTNPGWYDGGKSLLFASDRDNRTNLFSLRLADGVITQLTDEEWDSPPYFLNTSISPVKDEACFWNGRKLTALDLAGGGLRVIYEAPPGWHMTITSVTADGRFACAALYEDFTSRGITLEEGYLNFARQFEAGPRSFIIKAATDGSGARTIFEEKAWVGHVNASPLHPNLATYCHEGPWDRVDQRIWGIDLDTGRTWKIRPTSKGELAGHEYWLKDGDHVAYHGGINDKPMYGCIKWDNTGKVEAEFPFGSEHFHSNSLDLIVGDGEAADPINLRPARDFILLWRFRNGVFEGPRRLLRHRGSFHVQAVHAHPCITPDGKQVLYTSDRTGYGNIYLADLPEFESLPEGAGPAK